MKEDSTIGSVLSLVAVFLIAAAVMSGCGGDDVPSPEPVIETATIPEPLPIPPPPGGAPDEPRADPVGDDLQDQIESILSAYSVDNQFSIIAELASDRYQGRKTGSAGAAAAAAFISGEFSRLGLEPWTAAGLTAYEHHFSGGGYEDDNVLAVLPGTDPGGRFVILAAHYDHLGVGADGLIFNGADDNAAGVSAVLETAAVLMQLGYRPASTIVFCAFSGEEQGQYGARALGQLITDAGLAGRTEMINVDGIGATGGSYFGVWDEGNPGAAPLVSVFEKAGGYLGTETVNEGTDIGSDAQPFNWIYGIPAVTVDWDWGSDPSAFHPYYHTVYDDAEAVDRPTLARATRVILVAVWFRAME